MWARQLRRSSTWWAWWAFVDRLSIFAGGFLEENIHNYKVGSYPANIHLCMDYGPIFWPIFTCVWTMDTFIIIKWVHIQRNGEQRQHCPSMCVQDVQSIWLFIPTHKLYIYRARRWISHNAPSVAVTNNQQTLHHHIKNNCRKEP